MTMLMKLLTFLSMYICSTLRLQCKIWCLSYQLHTRSSRVYKYPDDDRKELKKTEKMAVAGKTHRNPSAIGHGASRTASSAATHAKHLRMHTSIQRGSLLFER